MKRNNNLASLWNAHAQKQKAQKVSSSTPNQLIIHDQQVGPEIPCEEEIHETQKMEDQEARPENPSDEEIHEEQETEEGIYDVDRLPHDPGKRIPIIQYSANEQDAVRRGYIAKGPCLHASQGHIIFHSDKLVVSVAFRLDGLTSMIGLSTVWKRMLPSALFVICLRIQLIMLVVMLL